VRDYLIGKGVTPRTAVARAEVADAPLLVTKRGALLFGRRPNPLTPQQTKRRHLT
jgi:hypothetical protein